MWMIVSLIVQLVILTLVMYEAGFQDSDTRGTGVIFFGSALAWIIAAALLGYVLFIYN